MAVPALGELALVPDDRQARNGRPLTPSELPARLAKQMRTGLTDYNATVPAGKVGLWAGSGTASAKFDAFKLLDMAALVDVDGRWWDDVGDTSLVSGKLQFGGAESCEQHAIRRAFRGGKYVIEYDHPFDSGMTNGVILHYQDPENFMAVVITPAEPDAISLIRRSNGVLSTIATGSNFTMTSGHTVRCAIHDDPESSSLQELKVYVNGTLRMTTTTIDDDWSAGMAGLIVLSGGTTALGYDNVKIGLDNNADDDGHDQRRDPALPGPRELLGRRHHARRARRDLAHSPLQRRAQHDRHRLELHHDQRPHRSLRDP